MNPHLVMLSTCLQGQTGPYAEFPGFEQEGHALRLEATPGKLRWAAPALGEHTALVLREVLGMTEEEIVRLIDERVAW